MGADIGSSSCKIVLITQGGEILAYSSATYDTAHPHPGWAEQNPVDWYEAFCYSTRQCLRDANINAEQVSAVSITGPAHNAVLLDSDDRVLRPTIHWSDRRCIEQAQWIEENHREIVFETTYQPINPSWTLPQLLWVRQQEPEVWGRLQRIMIQKDYISFRLTGSWMTDPYDAMGTQLMDGRSLTWSQGMGDLIELPISVLPPVHGANEVRGEVTPEAAAETGLGVGTPVAVGSGDSVVEALGMGVIHPGQGIIKLASSGAVNVATKEPKPHPNKMTYPHLMPGRWYSICATNSGAATALWFLEAFGISDDPNEGFSLMEQLVEGVTPGSEGLLFHPYLEGERAPYWDPRLRGDFVGLTIRHRRAHAARAVYEGVAFSLRDVMDSFEKMALDVKDFRLLGGGSRSRVWSQIVADVFNRSLPRFPENATAYGAALLAGVAIGVYSDMENVCEYGIKPIDTIIPRQQAVDIYAELFSKYQRITKVLTPFHHELTEAFGKDRE